MMAVSDQDAENKKVLSEEKEFPIRHASDIIGNWGPYQRNIVVIHTLIYFVAAFNNLGITFYTPKVNFWCKRPPGYENATLQTCNSYENASQPCTEWEYDKSFYWSTLTDEFNLVCDRNWLRSMAASIYQIGYGVSSILTGLAADKYGRLRVFKWSIYLELVGGFSQALSVNMTHFLFSRFILAIGAFGRFTTGATLIFELVGPKVRDKVSVFIEAGWCAGHLLLPLVNYYLPNFRYVQLAVFAYEMFWVLWLPMLPESPRWQLTHGQFEEAEKTIIKAASMKGKIDEDELRSKLLQLKNYTLKEEVKLKREASKTIVDLWRVPVLLRYCIIFYFIVVANGFLFYGFSYNVGSLAGSMHLNVFFQALSGVSVTVMMFFIINKFPRKLLGIVCVFAGALSTLGTIPFTFTSYGTPYIMGLSTLSTFLLHSYAYPIFLMMSEIFPTTLRQTAKNSCFFVARFGSVFAPFVTQLVDATHLSVMMAIFGILALFVGSLVFLLPETRGIEIPDTIEEAQLVLQEPRKDSLKIKK